MLSALVDFSLFISLHNIITALTTLTTQQKQQNARLADFDIKWEKGKIMQKS